MEDRRLGAMGKEGRRGSQVLEELMRMSDGVCEV